MKKHFIYPLLAALCLTSLTAGGCSSKTENASSAVSASSKEASVSSAAPSETPAATPTADPATLGEGIAPSEIPDPENTISRQLKEACVFSKDGQQLYTVTISDISFTERRAVVDTEAPEKVLLITYTYQSLTDDPVLVDDMSFRCMVNGSKIGQPYYLADQTVAEPAGKDQEVTAEVAFSVPADTSEASLYLTNNANPEGESFLISVPLL